MHTTSHVVTKRDSEESTVRAAEKDTEMFTCETQLVTEVDTAVSL